MPDHSIKLVKIIPEKNQHRYYQMTIQENLFADFSLVTEYGRIGRSGRLSTKGYKTHADALAALNKKLLEKLKKGYIETLIQ